MTLAVSGTVPSAGPLVVSVPEDPAVRIAFTRRTADGGNLSLVVGDGDAVANRRAALAALGADPGRAVFMQQVHGGDVAAVGEEHAGRGLDDAEDSLRGVDGLVTTAPDLPLVVLAADCVPVVLVDPGRAVGAVHAGRGGVVAGVVARAVGRLAGSDASNVVAVIGPAIGGCCYEVPQAMADAVTPRWPAARATTTWGTPALDLPAAVAEQLRGLGVARVERVGACTHCNAGALFSHRAASAGRAPHGRQAGIVVRTGARAGAPAQPQQGSSLQSP